MHAILKTLGLSAAIACLLGANPLLAQSNPKPQERYKQQCVQQQRAVHQRLSDKVSDADFIPYCSCVASALEKNLTPEQFRDLGKNATGAKPAWLKQAEAQASRSCIPSEPKLQV